MTSAENWVTTHKKIETYFSDFSKICYSVSKAQKNRESENLLNTFTSN